MNIQNYMRTHEIKDAMTSLDSMGVTVKQHPELTELYQFTYDTVGVPSEFRKSKLVRECRGLILNAEDNWNVVAYPFYRFFNYGEELADEIDWNTARVQEKIDGSLIILYHYKDKWRVATRGSITAGGQVGENDFSFSELFWSSCEYWYKGLCKSGDLNKKYTYMIELTSPYNRVVCDYTKVGWVDVTDSYGNPADPWLTDTSGYSGEGSRITLIGVRNNETLEEIPVSNFRDDWHYVVREFPLTSIDEVLKASEELNPLQQEGYVIVDGNFNRIKVKSPKYVLIHHVRDNFTTRRIIDLIRLGEMPEVLAYYPEYVEKFKQVQLQIDFFVDLVEKDWNQVNEEVGPEATQKEFALKAVCTRLPGALFSMRKGEVKSIREYLMKMPTEKLEQCLV